MGGAWGPIVANEFPLAGLAVFGTSGRPWTEYSLDMYRSQPVLAGADPGAVFARS
jgi:hypothetical protein